jgi:hypothetical protein
VGKDGISTLLEKYLKFTEDSEAPELYHIWSFLTVFGYLFRKEVYLDMGFFRLYPGQLFVFLVGPPAVKKSTAIEIATNLFLPSFPEMHITSGKLSTQALIDSLESRPIMNGTTLTTSDSITLIKSGELANFIPKQSYIEEIIPFLTDAFDARDEEWTYSTRSAGSITLKNTLITFLAGTTSDWLFSNIPESAWGGGFMSRIILVNQPDCDRENAIPSISLKGRRLKLEILTETIYLMNRLKGEFFWSKEGRQWYTEWYSQFKRNQPKNASNALTHYYARKPIHLLKIGMTIAIMQNRSLFLTQKALETAEELFVALEIFLPDLLERRIVANPIAEQCQNVLDFLRGKGGTVTKSDLLRGLWRSGLNSSALDLVLDTLLQADLVELIASGKNYYYRLQRKR